MYPWHTAEESRLDRQTGHWCNVCNVACESDAALREHYRQCHPELAARLEWLHAHVEQGEDAGRRNRPVEGGRQALAGCAEESKHSHARHLLSRARQAWELLRHGRHD